MSLKSLGAVGLALAVLLFLLAAAQPATVTESSTTCIDSTYYQDCSTVDYERANPQRAQLFAAAGVVFVLGLITYGVGAARSSGDAGGGGGGPRTGAERANSATGTDTLREQLAAHQSAREAADSSVGEEPGRSASAAARDSGAATQAAAADSAPESAVEADARADPAAPGAAADARPTSPTVGVVASALASAFLLSWLLGSVASIDGVVARALVFALFAVPGVALYRRYADDADAGGAPEVSD